MALTAGLEHMPARPAVALQPWRSSGGVLHTGTGVVGLCIETERSTEDSSAVLPTMTFFVEFSGRSSTRAG